MKLLKLIPLALLIALVASPAQARMSSVMCGGGVAVSGECTTPGTKQLDYPYISSNSSSGIDIYVATKIVVASDMIVWGYKLDLKDQYSNPGTGTYTIALRADDGGVPSSSDIAGTSKQMSGSGISNAFLNANSYEVILPSSVEIAAGTYWVVRSRSTSPNGYAVMHREAGGASHAITQSANGVNWDAANTNYYYMVEVWGCQK